MSVASPVTGGDVVIKAGLHAGRAQHQLGRKTAFLAGKGGLLESRMKQIVDPAAIFGPRQDPIGQFPGLIDMDRLFGCFRWRQNIFL